LVLFKSCSTSVLPTKPVAPIMMAVLIIKKRF
jgi:hypothetical protein